MLDTGSSHPQMTTAILALNTKWDYYLHGTNMEQNLWKKDSAWCLRFDNISIAFLSQLYRENGIKWGVKIIKDVWDKRAQWLYSVWAGLEKVTEHDVKVKREDFLRNLQAYKNTPYKMWGKDKNGIDCSRLIFESLKPIFGDFSGEICAEDFSRSSQAIEAKDAQVGDFVLLNSENGIANHIAVITALSPDLKIIGASSSEWKVTESIMNYKNPLFHKNSYIQ